MAQELELDKPDVTLADRGDPRAPTEWSSDLDDSLLARCAGTEEPEVQVPSVGRLLDEKYQLEEMLGRGGAGVVFGARNVVTDRPVAIKWMIHAGNVARMKKRFVQEARAAGRIHHPNVIDIYDVISSDTATYLVMERLYGESLRARLRRGALETGEVVKLCTAILAGLAEAHRFGVIHRDLKPENVFLCDGGAVKLLDFGICALEQPRADGSSELTRTGEFVGTPAYTALERLRDDHPFDHRVDIYSVGVIAYEALTGRLPFRASRLSELTYQLTATEPAPPNTIRPLGSALNAAVMRALARDPEQRFPTADAFIAALNAAPLEATPRALAARRSGARAAGALLVAALFMGAAATRTWHARSVVTPAGAASPIATHATVPAGAPAAITPAPPATSEAPAPAAPESAVPLIAAPTHRRKSTPTVASAVAPTATDQPVRSAKLEVVVFPYGDVWIDGKRVGASPQKIAVAPGAHTVSGGRTSPTTSRIVNLKESDAVRVVLE